MAEPDRKPPLSTMIARPGSLPIVRVGLRKRPLGDLYHFFMNRSWRTLLLFIAVTYLGINLIFASIYYYGHGIENARPGSFADAFYFSVQTMATIGYGKLIPRSPLANTLVTLEALIGLLSVAMATGIIFSKFSRPTARVMFSKLAVIDLYEGFPSLMFRMANERANQVAEAQLHVVIVRNEKSKEGHLLRRMYDLELVRASSIVFALSWTAIHRIDEQSPLFGQTPELLAASETEIVVSLVGYDETFSQTIHARHSYVPDEIMHGVRFVDVLSRLPDGRRQVDYSRFHDVMALDQVQAIGSEK